MGRIPAQALVATVTLAAAASPVSLVFPCRARADATVPAGFQSVPLATGLTQPTAVAWAPDGRMFIAEKPGLILVVDSRRAGPTELLDISGHVNTYQDRGLLGVAVDSNYADNHFLYLLYTYEDNPANYSGPKVSRLTRVVVSPDDTVAGGPTSPTETVVLGSVNAAPCPAPSNSSDCLPADGDTHSADTVRSDPDGTLWVSNGEAAGYRQADPLAFRAYDETSYAGKILHIDRAGNGLPDHPFCPSDHTLTDVCTKVYAKGFRNPYRFSLSSGASPVVGDVGWGSWEEIDFITPGGNYGWPCWEGPIQTPGYSTDSRCSDPQTGVYTQPTVPPVYAFDHSQAGAQGLAVVGGPTYTGTDYPSRYSGTIFFGAYGGGFIRRLVLTGGRHVKYAADFATGVPGLVDLESAPGSGDLVYVDVGNFKPGTGSVYEIAHPLQPPAPQAGTAAVGSLAAQSVLAGSVSGLTPVLGPTSGRASVRLDRSHISGKHRVRVITGTATDPAGVRELDLALARGARAGVRTKASGARCEWWERSRVSRPYIVRSCSSPAWMPAKLARPGDRRTGWRLLLAQSLRSGAYTMYFREVDEHGVASTGVAEGAGQLRISLSRRR
jgi:glucose/arabinose dehydrogenase